MRKERSRELFRRRRSRRKVIIFALLGVMVLLGLTSLADRKTPRAQAGTLDAVTTTVKAANGPSKEQTITTSTEAERAVMLPSTSGVLVRRFNATLTVDGESRTMDFIQGATVADMLAKAEIKLAEEDTVSEALSQELAEGMSIKVVRVTTEKDEVTTETEYETTYQEDDTIYEGETKVIQEGENRITKETFNVTYNDGKEAKRELENTEVISEGKEKIIAIGTKPVPEPEEETTEVPSTGNQEDASSEDSSSGESSGSTGGSTEEFSYSKAFTCKAYAYTAPKGAVGASGNPAVVGTCAVDPSVIPLGTRLYIEGYGYATANDTGGMIIGNTVDLFMETTAECYNWGVRNVTVYVLD